MPWAPLPATEEARVPWFLEWEQSTPAGLVSHRFTWKMGDDFTRDAAIAVHARAACHAIISSLPDQAITDLFTQMVGILEAYMPPPIPITDAPSVRRIQGKLGKRFERQTFPVEE